MKSTDDVSWTRVATLVQPAVAGHTETAPIDWPVEPVDGIGGNFFDRTSVVRVQLISGTLTSSTRDAVLADRHENLFALQKSDGVVEMFQAVNANLVSTGVYDLSMLLRGRFGTEHATNDHEVNESFALVTSTGFAKPTTSTAEIGTLRYYKGVTIGRNSDSAVSREHTDNGAALMPYAVSHLRAFDNGDGTFDLEWARRSRLETRFLGQFSSSVPLGEESESYVVEVYDGADALQSTQTVSDPEVTVTASSGWYAIVYQVSAAVGRGYPTEIEL
jgi:hypothetical protein